MQTARVFLIGEQDAIARAEAQPWAIAFMPAVVLPVNASSSRSQPRNFAATVRVSSRIDCPASWP